METEHENRIYAPVSGVITSISSSEGALIRPGEVLMTIRAQDFDKAITYYKTGLVSKVLVDVGREVKQGDLLMLITDDVKTMPSVMPSANAQQSTSGNTYSDKIPTRNSTVAGLLALFLGSLGIHDFYAGRYAYGVTKIVLSLVGLFSMFTLVGTLISLAVNIWIIVDMFQIAGNRFGSDSYIISTKDSSTTWIYIIIGLKIAIQVLVLFL